MATAERPKIPAVLSSHYVVPSSVPNGDFKAKCNYCAKEITGSVKSTTNWWKHLVSINTITVTQMYMNIP